jgi:hypothetical protein
MNRRTLYALSLSLIALFAGEIRAQAVQPADESIQVTFHVLSASPEAAAKKTPPALAGVVRQLSQSFGIEGVGVSETFFGMIGRRGSVEYKSVSNASFQGMPAMPGFLDWKVRGAEPFRTADGADAFVINSVSFGMRVPVRTNSNPEGAGQGVVNYVWTGISLDRTTIRDGVPTLVGTLSLPNSTGKMYLVLTLSSVRN